ncbi:MAG: aldehyde ferredoxin oxidoreductase C-terminal domain-containing protein [Anaerolineae bacterium]
MQSQLMRAGGSLAYMDWALMSGDIVFNYYTQGAFGGVECLTRAALADNLLIRARACYRCPIGCGRESRATGYGMEAVCGPEYETVGAYAALLASPDLEGAAYVSHLCNRYGLDTISTGSTIAFAYYLYQQGLLDREATGGLELRWEDLGPALVLTEQIARREGLGNRLAEGSRRFGQALGVEHLAVQVKGMEVPMHDPRAFAGLALVYALSPRGACHMAGDLYMVYQGQIVPELGIDGDDRQDQSEETVRVVASMMDWRSLTNSLIMCHYENPLWSTFWNCSDVPRDGSGTLQPWHARGSGSSP